MGPIDKGCVVNAPVLRRTIVRLPSKGAFAVGTPHGRRGRVCVHSVGLGNGGCAGGCVARRSVVGNKALRFMVATSPKG